MTILTLTKVDVGMMEDVGTSANNIIQLDSNAKIPAVDGSLVTGVVSGLSGSSDPTISTNPSSGVGTKYTNTTSGNMFICTDATAGSNVWTNVGEGTGNVAPYVYQGSAYGYAISGYHHPPGGWKTIDRYSFTTDGNATDVGDLQMADAAGVVQGYWVGASASSSTYAYCMGQTDYGGLVPGNAIEKLQLVATADGTDIGDLVQKACESVGCSDGNYGYVLGGQQETPLVPLTMIQSLAYASEVKADTTADLYSSGYYTRATACQNTTHGFKLGGAAGGPAGGTNGIERWQMATTSDSTDVGDLTGVIRESRCGTSSLTHGYTAGGTDAVAANKINRIEKVQMVASANSTDVADMLVSKVGWSGSTSTTHGYAAGHLTSSAGSTDINKFSHTSDANATDVGDLVGAKSMCFNSQI